MEQTVDGAYGKVDDEKQPATEDRILVLVLIKADAAAVSVVELLAERLQFDRARKDRRAREYYGRPDECNLYCPP